MSGDEKYFGIVSKELSIGRMDEALWTKAFALENGQESATKARYIRLRVEQLQAADRSLHDSEEPQEIAGADRPTQKAEISSGMLWGRFWAKAIDVSLVELAAIFGALAVHPAESNYWIVALSLFLVGYVTYETLSLNFFQTSLGRLLFGIKVVPVGDTSLSDIAGRTLSLIFSGLGGFLPVVSLITQVVAYGRVRRTGEAGWDAGKFKVLYGPDKGWKYWFAALFGFLLMLTANTFLNTLDKLVQRQRPTIIDPFQTREGNALDAPVAREQKRQPSTSGLFDDLLRPGGASPQNQRPAVVDWNDFTPIVARVNGIDIYQVQVDAALSRLGNIRADNLKSASKQALDKIIEESFLLQQAQEKKLDRDPKVAQTITASRNGILVKAYLDQLASSLGKPTDAEIQAFFDANPALFKERKIYNLRELTLAARQDLLPKLQEAVAKAKGLEDVAEWLKSEKVSFSVSAAPKAAEQLPLELVPRFAAMKDGDLAIIPTPTSILVEQLMGSRVQPVDLAMAKPAIERLLADRNHKEIAGNELKRQMQRAKIEYFGEFTQSNPMISPSLSR